MFVPNGNTLRYLRKYLVLQHIDRFFNAMNNSIFADHPPQNSAVQVVLIDQYDGLAFSSSLYDAHDGSDRFAPQIRDYYVRTIDVDHLRQWCPIFSVVRRILRFVPELQ
jgi:hypothetical protein